MSIALPTELEAAVNVRYSGAARQREESLCCPTSYPRELLRAIPEEVLERDYGCGNPSEHLRRGERVLDLGSGTGKICFIAAQVVGKSGEVIGVDANEDMLSVARGAAPVVAERLGYANVRFGRGRIQDLALDLERLDQVLKSRPVRSAADLGELEATIARLRSDEPLVANASIDVVISSCVLNLVRSDQKPKLFSEIHRVLAEGGRAVISDIVSDERVPPHLARDPELWSGCISGALREDLFLQAFEEAGFHGVTLVSRQSEPWRVVDGIEFRSVTVEAHKGKEGPCLDQRHAVVYRGPFREVVDDDDHVLRRGVRTAVCAKTFQLYARHPYRAHVELIEPAELVPLEDAPPFPCDARAPVREPAQTKRGSFTDAEQRQGSCCGPDAGACC